MLTREVKYGIRIGFSQILISPLGIDDYAYQVSGINVEYNQSQGKLQFEYLSGTQNITISRLFPNQAYDVQSTSFESTLMGTRIVSDSLGNLMIPNVQLGSTLELTYSKTS